MKYEVDSFAYPTIASGNLQRMRDMMLLKIKKLGEGLHPSEIFVSVETRNGPEEIAVDAKSLRNGTLPIGWPVGKDGGFLLVELPRPTVRGTQRVWVRKEELVPDKTARKSA